MMVKAIGIAERCTRRELAAAGAVFETMKPAYPATHPPLEKATMPDGKIFMESIGDTFVSGMLPEFVSP